MTASFTFGPFVLDTVERRLVTDNGQVEINGRYFDALVLLVRERGKLVSKDRFMSEVWRGVPVTDEALTQCIKTLRRQLADDAGSPRFIETVPKHGYRFIAPVDVRSESIPLPQSPEFTNERWRPFTVIGLAGTLGGVLAGVIGGLIYGFAGSSLTQPAGVGALSILLVLLCVTVLVAAVGGAAVSFAIATAELASERSLQWLLIAGAGGGLIVGAFTKLLGLDAFSLLVGRSPADITGGLEGLLIGAAIGLGAWFSGQIHSLRRTAAAGALLGGLAGVLIPLLGGRLLLGSLVLLTRGFPESRLHVDQISRLFGEVGFGAVTAILSSALESALFSGCVIAAMAYARRKYLRKPD